MKILLRLASAQLQHWRRLRKAGKPTGAPRIRDATQMQGVIAERALPFIALKGQYIIARGDGGRRPSEPWGTGVH